MNKIDKYLNEQSSSSDLEDMIEDIKMALDDFQNTVSAGKGNPKGQYKSIMKELKRLEKYI